MPFNLELTISGLVVVAVKSKDPRPTQAEAVDVICPNAHMHRPRLTFKPLDLMRGKHHVDLELDLDHTGRHLAALDLRAHCLRLEVIGGAASAPTMSWGEEKERPADPSEEKLMNWLPALSEIGFPDFTIPGPGQLPIGASARLTLPKGEVVCANVVKNRDKGYIRYKFPLAAKETIRAVANDVIFRASGVEELLIKDHQGHKLLTSPGPADKSGTLQMCISNDLAMVAEDYGSGFDALKHLEHLGVLGPVHKHGFEPPKAVADDGRTGDPICDGVFLQYS